MRERSRRCETTSIIEAIESGLERINDRWCVRSSKTVQVALQLIDSVSSHSEPNLPLKEHVIYTVQIPIILRPAERR